MSRPEQFKFRLYVAGDAPNSLSARANLKAFCRMHLPDQHHIEIVDVLRESGRALADGIFMTPMLVKLSPAPVRRIVGVLSNTETLLHVLGVETLAV